MAAAWRRRADRRRAAVLVLVGALATLGIAGPSAHADTSTCTVNALLVNSCRPWFGAAAANYPQVRSDRKSQLLYFEKRTGRQVDIAHTYHAPGDDQLSATDVFFATRPGTMLLTNWALTRDWARADGSDPAVNDEIDQMASSVKSLGDTKIFLVLSHEPENDVSSAPSCPTLTPKGTSGTPDQYRAMWANVRQRFDAAGVDNVVWVMDYMNSPTYRCLVDALYPGDDLVDWVVFNAYQHGNTDVSFVRRVSNMYDYLTTSSRPGHDYLSKPWGIVEWSINHSTQPNAYLYDAQAKAAVEGNVFPRLKFYLVYDNGDYGSGDFSYRVAYDINGRYDAAEQDAFNKFAASPALAGSWSREPTTTPTDLRASMTADGAVSLTWSPPAGGTPPTGYRVYRDGTQVATVTDPAFTDTDVSQGASYTYSVTAVDDVGNSTGSSRDLVVTVPDTTPPGPAADVTAAVVDGVPHVTWTAADDNVSVTGYDVLRDGVLVGTTPMLSFDDTPASQGSEHVYAVRARDAAGNTSGAVAADPVTAPDTTPPSVPTGLVASFAAGVPRVAWIPSTDNVGVASYDVFRDGVWMATSTDAFFVDISAAQGAVYSYTVGASDAAGNSAPVSDPLVVTVPDTQAPSVPTGLTATLVNGVPEMTWAGSSDNVGVAGYDLLRDGKVVGRTPSESFTDSAAPQGTTHTYAVRARDAAGNASGTSGAVSLPVPDTRAPSPPGPIAATRSTTSVKLTWGRATDNVGVSRYLVSRGGTVVARVGPSTTSYSVTGLSAGTKYTFSVRARDAAGNVGPAVSVLA